MSLVNADFVEETTNTTGTGSLQLLGPTTGSRTFTAAIGQGNTCVYSIKASDGNRESGIGTVGATSLSRDTLLASSTGSHLILPAGTHTVFCTLSGSNISVLGFGLLTATSAVTQRSILGIPDATQAEMEGGVLSATRTMTPLGVRQAIDAVTGDIEAALIAING